MKNIKLALIAMVVLGRLSYAGGEFQVVTPYEMEDISNAEETPIEEVVEQKVIKVAPPVVVKTAVVKPPIEKKDIYANGFYVGLGISATQYKTNCKSGCANSGTDKTVGIVARAGYDFNKYIGLEARGIRTSIIKHAGVFIKPMIPISDKTNIYGLVGLAKTSTQGNLQRTDAETLAMGAGVEVDLSKDSPKDGRYGRKFDGKGDQERGIGLFVDYERMVAKSGAPDLDALSAGVTYDF